jgi:hypothetical protein
MNYDPDLFGEIRALALDSQRGALLMLAEIVERLVLESAAQPEPEAEAVEVFQFMGGGSLPK